jgi:hypothetical protein
MTGSNPQRTLNAGPPRPNVGSGLSALSDLARAGLDMKLEWNFTAESYLDQLPSVERSRVLHVVKQLPTSWDGFEGTRLHRLKGDQNDLFSLRVGSDLRVLVRRRDDVITVVDVVRRSQVDGLRRVTKQRQAASG